MAADPIVYCLEQVTDYDQFERLCHDLMAAEGYTAIEPLGGMKDKGRDAIHVGRLNGKDVTIFAYSVRDDWRKKLEEDCWKIHKHGHKCNRLGFLCTAAFTPMERDEAVAFARETFCWHLDLYGLERLRILLGTVHTDVLANHPQIFCPPFFPKAGGLTVVSSHDYLVIDYCDQDEVLGTWLARRLTLEGYKVWCRGLAPVGGSSLNDTLEALVRHRAFRLLSILSPSSLADPDLSSRRSLASTSGEHILLPILAESIDPRRLDAKTRALEPITFSANWATGLGCLLEVLASHHCPREQGGASIALRSFTLPNVVRTQPETLYSNRFRVLSIPEVIKRFSSTRPMDKETFATTRFQWAFRRVNPHCFLAFHQPPQTLREQLDIHPNGVAMWHHAIDIDGVLTRNLVPELIRKSIEVTCIQRGLRYCNEQRCLYFPEGLVKSDRLYFTRPDGSKTFVRAVGQRTYWRPGVSTPYKYQFAPKFSVERLTEASFAVVLRIRVRLTNEQNNILPARTAVSRRKHLCKDWWNDDWLNRILAIMQFLAIEDRVILGNSVDEVITVTITPDHWAVPLSINEAALDDASAAREEVLIQKTEDDDELTN